MTRAVNIGRGSVGQARLPRSLPGTGGPEAARTIGEGFANARGNIEAAFARRDARIEEEEAERKKEQEKIEKAQSAGQLKLASNAVAGIGIEVQTSLEQEPEVAFESAQGVQDLQSRLNQQVDEKINQFRQQNPLNEDAALVFDSQLPALRLALSNSIEKGSLARSRNILRAKADKDALLRLGAVQTFEDVDKLVGELRGRVYTPELFSASEAAAKEQAIRIDATNEVLAQAYDFDPVEGATMALEMPDDDPDINFRRYVRAQQKHAEGVLRGHFDPIKGIYGFATMLGDIEISGAESVAMAQNNSLLRETFENKEYVNIAKEMGFLQDKETIIEVFGGGARGKATADLIADNFVVARAKLAEEAKLVRMAYGFASGEFQGAGPFDPMTIRAVERGYGIGGQLDALMAIPAGLEGDILFKREFTALVRQATTWTKSPADLLVNMFTNDSDPAMQARAAQAYGHLTSQGNFILRGPAEGTISDQMKSQMAMINTQISRRLVAPGRAVEQVLERTKNVNLRDKAAEFDKLHLEGQLAALNDLQNTWVPDIFTRDEGLEIPGDLSDDFRELTKNFYQMTNGDIGIARHQAWLQLQLSWEVTTDGGVAAPLGTVDRLLLGFGRRFTKGPGRARARWAHRPPGLMFKSGPDNGWQDDEFQKEFLETVGRAPTAGRFLGVENLKDPKGRPAYMFVETGVDGFPVMAETKDSKPGSPKFFIYVPDTTKSPRAVQLEKDGEASEEEARVSATAGGIRDLDVLRRQLEIAIRHVEGSPLLEPRKLNMEDIQFLEKTHFTLALINQVEQDVKEKQAGPGARSKLIEGRVGRTKLIEGTFLPTITRDQFEEILKSFKSRIPFTSKELLDRGVAFNRWVKAPDLQAMKRQPFIQVSEEGALRRFGEELLPTTGRPEEAGGN